MRIEAIELRLLRLPLVRSFETSFGRTDDRAFVLVTVHAEGLKGYGECVADERPYYSAETSGTAWHVLEQFIAPAVMNVSYRHPNEIFPSLAKIRGHQMAKAAFEMAAWDLFARQENKSLRQVLGGSKVEIEAGVSLGIQESVDELLDRIETERREGYRRIKVKIKPGWDVDIVEAIRARFDDLPLMVDANAAYSLDDSTHLSDLDRFQLLMIEQPLAYDDILDHAKLQARLRTPICLDESIGSAHAAHQAIEAGACRIVNIKPGRVGGLSESVRLHDICASRGVPVWHGGMLESGIGRTHNVHLSTLPNFSLPGDVAASKRYFQPDLVEPEIVVGPTGTIQVPSGPGLGVEINMDRVERATEKRLMLCKT